MSDLLQHLVVGAAALGAAAFLLRAVLRVLRPAATPSGCEHCALNPIATAPPE